VKQYNPIMEGIKKHGLAKNFFLELKERVKAGNGLTAREWDWYHARQKEWEPEVLAAQEIEARHSNDMEAAKRLSAEDLRTILQDKIANAVSGSGSPE
jgi:hypothetical protein